MRRFLRGVLTVAGLTMVSSAANAAVVYTFSTNEPMAGGTLSFTYEAPDFVGDSGFIQRSALTNVVGDIERIRFETSCPFGGGAAACDQLTVFSRIPLGSAVSYRYFRDGAFASFGSAAGLYGISATLTVTSANAGAVPEPMTWGLVILGFGAVGGALRAARHRQLKPYLRPA